MRSLDPTIGTSVNVTVRFTQAEIDRVRKRAEAFNKKHSGAAMTQSGFVRAAALRALEASLGGTVEMCPCCGARPPGVASVRRRVRAALAARKGDEAAKSGFSRAALAKAAGVDVEVIKSLTTSGSEDVPDHAALVRLANALTRRGY